MNGVYASSLHQKIKKQQMPIAKMLGLLKSILRRAGLLPLARRLVNRIVSPRSPEEKMGAAAYVVRIAAEQANYAECTNVHELPEIFHYWSNKYLKPKCEQFGFTHPDSFFVMHLARTFNAKPFKRRFVSIGAGNCDTEVRLAKALLRQGFQDFVIECIDINSSMLARGAEDAAKENVSGNIAFIRADFNSWRPETNYDAVIANQSLHHVLHLEHLFGSIEDGLKPDGLFITSDMIGRNGHQRWPEALSIVQEFWQELPAKYRYNQLLKRDERTFLDWDCSVSGFEGIRAQDILPLLTERFSFEVFLPFANAIDSFIDRAFGHNFDATAQWDRDFIDRVHARDEREILAGHIKPAHMMAVMRKNEVAAPQFLDHLTPTFCIRHP